MTTLQTIILAHNNADHVQTTTCSTTYSPPSGSYQRNLDFQPSSAMSDKENAQHSTTTNLNDDSQPFLVSPEKDTTCIYNMSPRDGYPENNLLPENQYHSSMNSVSIPCPGWFWNMYIFSTSKFHLVTFI